MHYKRTLAHAALDYNLQGDKNKNYNIKTAILSDSFT